MTGFDGKLYRDVKAALGMEREVIDGFLSVSKLGYHRLKTIIECLVDSSLLEGDTAEIGVATGKTSRIIATLNHGATHWACDTFCGLVDVSEEDGKHLRNGMLCHGIDEVMLELYGLGNVLVTPGVFPSSAGDMANKKYKFVHIDVDTYKSTIEAWEFFKDRMIGGHVVFDDVLSPRCVGAMKAWLEMGLWNKYRITSYPPQAVVHF